MTEQDHPVYCDRCGSIVQAGDRFCGVCGASIPSDAQEATPTQEIPTIVNPPQQVVPPPGGNSTLPLVVGIGALAAVVVAVVAIVALNLLGGPAGGPQQEDQAKPPPVAATQQKDEQRSASGPAHSASGAQARSEKSVQERTVAVQEETTGALEPTVVSPAPSDASTDAYDAVVDYYGNAESGDWSYTYNNLTSADQASISYEQWLAANEYAGTSQASFQIDTVTMVDSGEVQVDLTVYSASGADSRTTFFLYEYGAWRHGLTEEELTVLGLR